MTSTAMPKLVYVSGQQPSFKVQGCEPWDPLEATVNDTTAMFSPGNPADKYGRTPLVSSLSGDFMYSTCLNYLDPKKSVTW